MHACKIILTIYGEFLTHATNIQLYQRELLYVCMPNQ